MSFWIFKANFLQVKYIKNPEIMFNRIVRKPQTAMEIKSISLLASAWFNSIILNVGKCQNPIRLHSLCSIEKLLARLALKILLYSSKGIGNKKGKFMDFYLRWYNRGTVNPDNPYININCTLNNNKSSTGHIINTIWTSYLLANISIN